MKAIETTATFTQNGDLVIDNPPKIKNKQVKLLFLYEDEDDEDDAFYRMAAERLSQAYSADEPEYDLSMIKEHSPHYKNEGR